MSGRQPGSRRGRDRSLLGRGCAGLGCAALVTMTVAACGSSSSSDLSAKGEKALRPYVQSVRDAAASNSRSQLSAAVRNLKREAKSLAGHGEISADRQADLDDAADALETDVAAAMSPSPSPSTSSSTPSTPPTTAPPTTASPTTQPPTTSPPATATVTQTDTSTSRSTATSSGGLLGGGG